MALSRLLAALALGLVVSAVALSVAASPPPSGLHLLHADGSGLTLEWVAPPVQVLPLGDGAVKIIAEGYLQTTQPGMPRLPFTSTLIALPPGVDPHLQILLAEETTRPLPGPLSLAPYPAGVIRDEKGLPVGGAFTPTSAPDQSMTGRTGGSQARQEQGESLVTLEEIGVVRGVRLARLTFYPALPEGDSLRLVRRLRVEIRWEPTLTPHPRPATPGIPSLLSEGRGGRGEWGEGLLPLIRQAVLNPWDAIPAPPPSVSAMLKPTGEGRPTALIEVTAPGLYRVAYEDVEGLGFAGTNPHNLRLFQDYLEGWKVESVAVAYEWEGNDDSTFDPGESLLFYAEPRFSRWTDVDVYRLVADVTPGLRMESRSADPSGLPTGNPWVEVMVEENHLYTPDCFCGHLPPGRDGDRWVWENLRYPDRLTMTVSFPITAPVSTQPATLTVWLIGYTDVPTSPDHRIDVALNGTFLGRIEWDGKKAITGTLPVTPGWLQNGPNTLTLSLPGIPGVTVEGAWLDAFAVRYARATTAPASSLRFAGEAGRRAYTITMSNTQGLRAYDVTVPLRPQRLTDVQVDGNLVTLGDPPDGSPRRYLVAGADGILRPARVRAPEDPWGFSPADAPTRAQRRSVTADSPGHRPGESKTGFSPAGTPAGADVLIITHPTFADTLDPLVALRHSQGLSTTVVNVLGIYDVYGDGRPAPEAIHAFIADAYATWIPRPAYVLLVGDGSFDPRRYRSNSPLTFIPPYLADVDPWAGETAADNRYACVDGDDALPDLLLGRLPVQTPEEAQTVVDKIVRYETAPLPGGWNANVLLVADDADAAGDFAASSEIHAAAYVTSPFTVTRFYCPDTSPGGDDCPPQEAKAIHKALLTAWNQGALLVQYTGHSSWHQWAVERLFHLDDLPSLGNDRRLPVVVEMTCFTGAFQRPEPTLDEALVTRPGGGAVATWGPTGLGVGTGHDALDGGFFRAVFADGVETVGQATLSGKLALVATGQNLDLLDTITLLGDPALAWNQTIIPWPAQLHLPLVMRGH